MRRKVAVGRNGTYKLNMMQTRKDGSTAGPLLRLAFFQGAFIGRSKGRRAPFQQSHGLREQLRNMGSQNLCAKLCTHACLRKTTSFSVMMVYSLSSTCKGSESHNVYNTDHEGSLRTLAIFLFVFSVNLMATGGVCTRCTR